MHFESRTCLGSTSSRVRNTLAHHPALRYSRPIVFAARASNDPHVCTVGNSERSTPKYDTYSTTNVFTTDTYRQVPKQEWSPTLVQGLFNGYMQCRTSDASIADSQSLPDASMADSQSFLKTRSLQHIIAYKHYQQPNNNPPLNMSTLVNTTTGFFSELYPTANDSAFAVDPVATGLKTTSVANPVKRKCILKTCSNCQEKIPCRAQTCKHCKTFIGLKDESKRRPKKPKAPLKRPASLKPCTNPLCDHMMGCKAKTCKKCGTVVAYKYVKTSCSAKKKVGRGHGRLVCTTCHASHGTKKTRCDCGATNTWDKASKVLSKKRKAPSQNRTPKKQKVLNDFANVFDDETPSPVTRPRAPSLVPIETTQGVSLDDADVLTSSWWSLVDELDASQAPRPRAGSMVFDPVEFSQAPRSRANSMEELYNMVGDNLFDITV